ncbi:MAG: alpha/beta fold hydrolase [Chloroflexi bacterium]|nr:alpha/beta fold hydrolase [Chloroflexota bacterium]
MASLLHFDTRTSLGTRLHRLGAFFLLVCAIATVVLVAGLSLQAARTVVYPRRSLDQVTPAQYGLRYERVEFPSADGLRLRGWFIPGGRAAIVLAHGHASHKGAMLSYAQYLHQRGGYSVLLFDFRASGESAGQRAALGYDEWRDVAGAVRYLQGRPEVNPQRIGALGASMGAAALLLMGEEAHQLRALVADSAFATAETMVATFDQWFLLPANVFSLSVPWAIEYYTGLKPGDISPLSTVGRIAPTPVLIIHGEKDTGIPVRDARALYHAAAEPKELWIIPGVGHAGGHGEATAEYQRRTLEFFGRYLGDNGRRSSSRWRRRPTGL